MLSDLRKNWLLVIAVVALMVLIFYRAATIPFTHDESATWLYLRHTNVWGCFFDPGCWNWGNNHWLNTILLQFFANIGGEAPIVLRMPNVLGGWAYLIAAALFVNRYLNTAWSRIAGFLFICLHIYLLDFFSLARGYGLMTSFVMWSIYSFLRYTEKFDLKWLLILLLSLFLSVLSNFTGIIPFAAMIGAWFVCILATKKYGLLKSHGFLVLIFSLGTYLLVRLPIKVLSEKGELEWGAAGFNVMIRDLFTNLTAGAHPFGYNDPLMVFWLVFTLLLISTGAFLSVGKIYTHKPLSISFLMLCMILSTVLAMQIFMDAKAPIGRKSIFIIPFVFSTLALCQTLVQRSKAAQAIAIAATAIIVIHFFGIIKYHIHASREWYFDANYPELFATIVPQGTASDSVKLGTSWIFVPSLTYYQKAKSLPISGLAYQKQLIIDTTMQYYYVDPSDSTGFHSSPFVLEKMVRFFCLFKNKNTIPRIKEAGSENLK